MPLRGRLMHLAAVVVTAEGELLVDGGRLAMGASSLRVTVHRGLPRPSGSLHRFQGPRVGQPCVRENDRRAVAQLVASPAQFGRTTLGGGRAYCGIGPALDSIPFAAVM